MARPIPYLNLSSVSRFEDPKTTSPIQEKDVEKKIQAKKGTSNNLVLVETEEGNQPTNALSPNYRIPDYLGLDFLPTNVLPPYVIPSRSNNDPTANVEPPRSYSDQTGFRRSTLNVDQHVWYADEAGPEICAIELRLARGPTTSAPQTVTLAEPDKPPDKPTNSVEEPPLFPEKPAFLPPKPIPHSPKISPSSIPNPSPSVTATKGVEPYPNFGGYLYSIPGYSAFQPVSYPPLSGVQPANTVATQNETSKEFNQFPTKDAKEESSGESKKEPEAEKITETKQQMDFEEQFMPEVVPAVSEVKTPVESKLSVAALTQPSVSAHEAIKKPQERFSLKTSIPISKIDMKCVNTPPDTTFQTSVNKTISAPFNPAFQTVKETNAAIGKVEIQSNVVIKTAANKEEEVPVEPAKPLAPAVPNNNITTLINAAEAISSNEQQFWKTKPKEEKATEVKDTFPKPTPTTRPIFNPINAETKISFTKKPPDGFNEQKNQQIVFIQNNKNPSNPKMLLTISQQQSNPQVVLQRASYESKNMLAPSRLSSLNKKFKDNHDGASSKVVALKRLHQENCDENDFENLITENQIYGNKIVVKEKSQGTLQEQDLKKKEIKMTSDKTNQTTDTKNVVIQPNFLYLSNVQFPANLMMIKNNNKVSQINEQIKINGKTSGNENMMTDEGTQTRPNDSNTATVKSTKAQNLNIAVSKELHVLKSSNNVLQTISNKTSNKTTDLYIQTNQKVLMNPQILYQVPMIVDSEVQKLNTQTFINRDYTKFLSQSKKELPRINEQTKNNDKLFIACPYQMDSKLQPKIVITNLRPKISKADEISTLDLYEKRKRLRRLKYLTNRDKDIKAEGRKAQDKPENNTFKNVITPDRMKAEIYKEFANTRMAVVENSSDGSDSDGDGKELSEYEALIEKYGSKNEQVDENKAEFLSQFRLATREVYKEKILDLEERSLQKDAVAKAYIAAGRIDRLTEDLTCLPRQLKPPAEQSARSQETWRPPEHMETVKAVDLDTGQVLKKKQMFLSQLCLVQVSAEYRDDYEKTWREIVKERRRRNGTAKAFNHVNTKPEDPMTLDTKDSMTIDTKDQLQIMTEITKSVGENNNLIKRRLDSEQPDLTTDSIHALAEKNFTELSKLSKMADRSVKLYSGESARKRDLNPGFDSENAQRIPKPHQQAYHSINIPNISKIISLKSSQEPNVVNTTPATSMDEPQNCAAGLKDEWVSGSATRVDGNSSERYSNIDYARAWPGVEFVMKSYRHFEAARKKEIADLHRRSAQLRVECACANRTAAKEAEVARALLAERQALANEETNVRMSIRRLMTAVEAIRNSS